MWDYLEPADSSSRHRAIAPAIDALWGAGTFTWLESEVLADGAGESTEPLAIPLRVWWEHKRLMALRFLYLEREGYLDPALGASAEARRIAGIAWQARLIALRRRQGDSEGTERIVALLRASAARELDTAGDVVHALFDGSRHRSAA